MAASEARFVVLRGGLALPVAPLLLALELEQRGFSLMKEEPDILVVQPFECLTRDDCARIRRWKPHLLAIVSHQPEVA